MEKMYWVCHRCDYIKKISKSTWKKLKGNIFRCDCIKCGHPMELTTDSEDMKVKKSVNP